jgi:hypothetical protein
MPLHADDEVVVHGVPSARATSTIACVITLSAREFIHKARRNGVIFQQTLAAAPKDAPWASVANAARIA